MFARVCVEIDLNKPIKVGYKLRGKCWWLQYKGLQDLCFTCGKYGHRDVKCLTRMVNTRSRDRSFIGEPWKNGEVLATDKWTGAPSFSFGPWMVAQRNRQRQTKGSRGILGNSMNQLDSIAGNEIRIHPSQLENKQKAKLVGI